MGSTVNTGDTRVKLWRFELLYNSVSNRFYFKYNNVILFFVELSTGKFIVGNGTTYKDMQAEIISCNKLVGCVELPTDEDRGEANKRTMFFYNGHLVIADGVDQQGIVYHCLDLADVTQGFSTLQDLPS